MVLGISKFTSYYAKIKIGNLFVFLSYTVLKVVNPFTAGVGIVQVMYTDTEYVVIQTHPKIVFAKTGYSIETYMQNQGYTKTNQEGAKYTFSKEDEVQHIIAHGPGHFAKWYWD